MGFTVDRNVLSLIFKISVIPHTPYMSSLNSLCHGNNVYYDYYDYYYENAFLCIAETSGKIT